MGTVGNLDGAADLMKMLTGLPIALKKRILNKALRAAAKPVLKAAKPKAPKGESGKLRKSGKIKKPKRKRRGEWAAVLVKFASPHAHLVHEGTSERHTKSGKSTGKIAPNPFLEEAFQAAKGEAIAIASKVVGEEVLKAAMKGASQ